MQPQTPVQSNNYQMQWDAFYQQSHDRFISYWLQYLQDFATRYDLLTADEENIRAAWISAAKQEWETELLQALDSLYYFYRAKGRISEGKAIFATAVSHLFRPEEDLSKQPLTRQKLYGRLLAYQAYFCHSIGKYTLTETLVGQAWWLLKKCDDKQFIAHLLITKGDISLDIYADATEAKIFFNQSFEQYQQLEDRVGMAHALHYLAGAYIWTKEYKSAKDLIQRAIALCLQQDFDIYNILVRSYGNLGVVYAGLGDFREAQASYQATYEAAYQLQNKAIMAISLANQSQIALKLNDYSKALELTHKQLRLSRDIGQEFLIAAGLTQLANAHYMLGEFKLAWDALQKSLEIAISTNGTQTITITLTQFSHLLYHIGNDLGAFTLLTILRSFHIAQIHQGTPENLYEILVTKLPPETVKAIQEEWKGKDLDDAVLLIQNNLEIYTSKNE